MPVCLLLFIISQFLACKAPGPLSADRDPGELYNQAEDNLPVVDAILIVNQPLPPVMLRRTIAPGVPYSVEAAALTEARVFIKTENLEFEYLPDPLLMGRYLPPEDAPVVASDRLYELLVETEDGTRLHGTTHTPPDTRITQFSLIDDDGETELRRLRLFSDLGDEVYRATENQLEYSGGHLVVQLEDANALSYQFTASNLEPFSPLLLGGDWFDEEDFDREETSPLLAPTEDGWIYLPWFGINFAGRYKVKFFAVDRNWYDLVRTDNVHGDRSSGEAGQGFQRPLFNITDGIGLFGSASVDSIGFFVQPEGNPTCQGCECWGCDTRPTAWSGVLDPNTGVGRVTYRRKTDKNDSNCELSYELTSAKVTDSCSMCSFAWEFTLGDLIVISDEGGCGDATDGSGSTVRFGQGKEVLSPGVGIPTYGLFSYEKMAWVPLKNGWSLMSIDGELEGMWLFGFSED
tara:strand:- start:337 stop:1719 length:1383 start_codon:yes stop_codon:yes gene_type:complete